MKPIKKRVGFFLQKRKKWHGKRDFERPVVLSFNYHGKRLYMLTGEKVSENNWDKKKQRVKSAINYAGEINDYLQRLDDKVNDAYYERLATGEEITNSYILDRLKNREKQEAKKSFWDHFEDYLAIKKRGNYGTYQTLRTARDEFKKFCTEKKLEVKFDDIEPKLQAEYNDFLLAGGNNNNTVGAKFKRLGRFLNYAFKQGLHTNQRYKNYTIPETVGPKKFLDLDEVKKLREVELTSVLEQKSRDLMLMGIYCGMRYSDIHNLKKADIQEQRFEGIDEVYQAAHVRTIKDSHDIVVPLLPEAQVILKKYEDLPGEFALPQLELQVVNDVIKNVGRKAKINATQKIESPKGNDTRTKYIEKWRVLSTHIGRKTFITVAATKGIPVNIVSSITGQHPSTIIKHYMGVLGPEKFNMMMEKMKF